MINTLRRYLAFLPVYAREAATVGDFVRLMRVRLSQSKAGRLVCPSPIVVDVSLRSLGGPVRLRSHTTDISVLGELLVGGSYVAAAEAAGAVSSIVDLGGNTGLAARWLLNRFPGAALVSVEPEDGNYALLEHNLEARGKHLHACAGGTTRTVSLRDSGKADGFQMVDDPAGTIRVLDMPMILATLGEERVDLLKVDIEGAERELFEECGGWIGRIRVLSVECHGGFSPDDLIATLEGNGAGVELIDRGGGDSSFDYETILLRIDPRQPAAPAT
jgi:FkbM family methyltransferase